MNSTVFKESGYRFFFSMEDERMHVHVISGDGEANFGLSQKLNLQSFIIIQESAVGWSEVTKRHKTGSHKTGSGLSIEHQIA